MRKKKKNIKEIEKTISSIDTTFQIKISILEEKKKKKYY